MMNAGTERLTLQPVRMEDAEEISVIANNHEVAQGVINIPHPYTLEDARKWIAGFTGENKKEDVVILGIREKGGNRLMGVLSIFITAKHGRAEFGYWLGREFWGKGYGTEAAMKGLEFCFTEYGLGSVGIVHFGDNERSGRVAVKAGFRYEGRRKGFYLKEGRRVDQVLYGLTKEDWEKGR